ncbi:MAG TPA: tetratricopeptide repeat protein [Rhodopseudomonas sp.]|uniref:tetratricopeptide repeat protein n=1 Tax=Rhodopseudomonas sp. TaxID=1078 RepID=UPI002ED81477
MTTLGIAIYDPRRLDNETFLAGFVARGDFVAFLLDKLRDMPDVAEHHIVVGPRGMGKTSLLRRLAIGISSEPALRQRFIPLTFREEQYNVRSLDALWRNCAEALAEWCESEGKAEVAAEIDRSLLTPEWRQSRSAVEAFLALSKRLGGRPVLFVDNLDLILDALTPEQNWELRRILQAPGGPVLFGAATQLLRQSGERDAAFYEFFHPHMLDPLSEAELLQCMNRLAQARGESGKAVSEILTREPERIRTLHTLTGGNPRVLTLVYQLLERSESDTVFSDLEVLLDQLTPFYKARVEEYQTDLQRAVIDAIALHWHPITSHDLSLVTAVDVTTISPQLNRLKRDGLVEEVQTSGARAGYQLVERFFNIWYLMRHGTRRTRQKIYWLTAFLSSFYAPAELVKMKAQAMSEGRANWHPLYREALEAVGEGGASIKKIDVSSRSADASDSSEVADMSHEFSGVVEGQLNDARKLMQAANKLASAGRKEEEIAVYDQVLSRFGTAHQPELREQVARALVLKGLTLGSVGRNDEEIAVYDQILGRFGTAEQTVFREAVARALVLKGLTLGSLGKSDEEIAVYDEVVSRFGNAEQPVLCEQVAHALVSKGIALGSVERSEEAIAVFDEVMNRFGTAEQPELRKEVTGALLSKGIRLCLLKRSEQALAVFDDVVRLSGAVEQPALREHTARALFLKGCTLAFLRRSEEAMAAYDEVVSRFGDAEQPALREQVAGALVNKGDALDFLGRSEEAVAVYDEVVKRFGTVDQPELRAEVARALCNKGIELGLLERNEQAISAYDEVVRLFGSAEQLEFSKQVARALVNKGGRLGSSERNEEAIAVYDEVVRRFGDAEQPELREGVARALVGKGATLDSVGQSEDAIRVYDEVVRRFGSGDQPALSEAVAHALVNKGVRLGLLGRSEEGIAVFKEVVSRFGMSDQPELRALVVRALDFGSTTSIELGRFEEAEKLCRRAAEIDSKDSAAWTLLGNTLADHSGKPSEAEAAYREAMSISDPTMFAEANLAWLLLAAGRTSELAPLRAALGELHPVGRGLLDAAVEISSDNFGAATLHLQEALAGDQDQLRSTFFDDLLRLLRIAESRGYGEKLIAWFVESGQAERQAPLYAAFVGYVRGPQFLLDFSPEIRKPAEPILRWLSSRRNSQPVQNPPKPKRRRGRPPRKHSTA